MITKNRTSKRFYTILRLLERLNARRRGGVLMLFVILLAYGAVGCLQPGGALFPGSETVPNLEGLPADQAAYYLKEAGIVYKIETQTTDDLAKDGRVIGQSPLPGRTIAAGQAVTIIVAEAPAKPTTDDGVPTGNETPHVITATLQAGDGSPTAAAGAVEAETPTVSPTLPTPTEASPTPQGGGGQIAFASDRSGEVQIWLVGLDGGEPTQLTDIDGGACQPSWSPDGKRMVFSSPCSGNQETYPAASLWLVNADGSDLEPLTSVPGGDFDPAWSPEGTQIAFTSVRDHGLSQIYIIKLEDRTFRNLSGLSVHEMQPAWSPDGSRLAYSSPSLGLPTVFIRDMAGGRNLQFSRDTDRANTHPSWSPDGSLIVYTKVKEAGVPALIAGRMEDLGFTRHALFIHSPMPMREAVFSPDGLWIAFESWLDGVNHDIRIGRVTGTQPERITSDPAYDFDPAWRP